MSKAYEEISGTGTFRALAETVRRVEFSNFDSREIVAAVHKLRSLDKPEPSVRIALLGTHTFAPLPDYLKVRAVASGKVLECWSGPHGQYMQPVIPPARELQEFQPDIVLLSVQMEAIAPQVAHDFAGLGEAEANAERRRILDHLLEWAELAARATQASILVCNLPRPRHLAFGVADAKRVPSESEFYLRLNLELLEALRPQNRVAVLDLDAAVASFGADRSWSRRLNYLSKQPWQPGLCVSIAREVWRHVIAAKGWARKCLVLDLDNTLWGGVVGEDGPMGVKIGAGDPAGEAYADFQRAIRSLKSRGVLLAVASKNNAADVDAVFEQRAEMVLRRDDFAVMQVGWQPKVQSLQAIAEALNIATDSLVFLDDSPAERAMVRGMMPEVLVAEMPEDPAHFASFLRRQGWFERSSVTEEDLSRSTQYRELAERTALRDASSDLSRYLADLGTEIEVRRARTHDVPRVHQLFTKTNQFNVTTRRYSLGEVEGFLRSEEHVLCVASARDRFGDLGSIGLYLLRLDGQDVGIDSFLLSCRALGRGIETAVMNALKQYVGHSGRQGLLRARFLPTPKNAPAADFFTTQGLEAVETLADGEVRYQARIPALTTIAVSHIRVGYGTRTVPE